MSTFVWGFFTGCFGSGGGERLKELDEEGIITKKIDSSSFPVKSEYTLTWSGLEIVDVIRGIKSWALKWKIDNIPCGCQDCKVCVL